MAHVSGIAVSDGTAEGELARITRQLRESQRIAHIGSWEWDIATDRIEWTEELFRLFGLDPSDPFDYDTYLERVHPDDRDRVRRTVARALEERSGYELEHRVRLPSGEERWLLGRGEVVVDASGAPVGMRGVSQDITERRTMATLAGRQRQMELQTRHASLGADIGLILTEAADVPGMLQRCAEAVVSRLDAAFARIWTVDDAGTTLLLRASAGIYTHLDGPHGRVPVGKFKIGLIAQERRPHLTNDVVGDPRVGDQAWARREGMVAFAGYPLIVAGHLVGVLAMFARHTLGEDDFEALATAARGISVGIGRMRSEASLRRSEAEAVARANALARLTVRLQRTNAELDAFAYAASHDLRAPLRGIANLAQWIEEDLQGSLRDETREMLALLRSRMHRMETLIEGILEYSRAGRIHQALEAVDVARLVGDVVELLGVDASHVSIEGDLPTLMTEPVPLQQIFQNLINNALKHGGPGVHVTIGGTDLGDRWRFRVSDNGPGIPPEFHERIWGIFQTLAPRDKVEGAGIGLSLVRKLVEAMGGEAGVASNPGQGATFWFEIPVSGAATEAE